MGHSLFAPSAAFRWLNCPGSMAFLENQKQDETSSVYADDGSATHYWAAAALHEPMHPVGAILEINGREFILDEDRAARIQGYVDDVRRRAIGGHLFVETRVDLSDYLGEGQGGTADAAIALPAQRLGIVEDLKDGSGEKVYASYIVSAATDSAPEVRAPNPQLALYALGLLKSFALFGPIDNFLLVIYQPKLDHIDEFPISVADLLKFGETAKIARQQGEAAIMSGEDGLTTAGYLNPGEKQCRWCRAKARCPQLTKFVTDSVRADFDEAPVLPANVSGLAKAYQAVPLIEQWCEAIKAELSAQVANGVAILGPDNQAYKFVEGREGSRKWRDEAAAEAALLGLLPRDKAFVTKLLTAPAAAKILDKKTTKNVWKDVFEPLIAKAPGRPLLVCGSDPRAPVTIAADALDFDDELTT